MQFINPSSLWLLLLLPPLAVAAVWLGARRNKRFNASFGEERLTSRYSQATSGKRTLVRGASAFLALAFVLVALARPTLNDAPVTVPAGTVDVVGVIDVSRSMAIESYAGKTDGAGTRLDMARSIVLNRLMPALGANKLSLVSYAGSAITQGFLTDDMRALAWVMQNAITIGGAPGDGTNVATGLTAAMQELTLDSPAGHTKVIVLFTDGDFYDSASDIQKVASTLRLNHIQLVIVGLGNAQAQPIPVDQLAKADQSRFSDQKFYINDAGEVERIAFNYQNVNNLKNEAGARFIHINEASDFDIANLFTGSAVTHKRGTHELFWVPLSLSVLFLVLALLAHSERYAAWRQVELKRLPSRRKRKDGER
jgi:hypothetical protein